MNELKASIKELEREVNQNKKEIEKVVRAEISSRFGSFSLFPLNFFFYNYYFILLLSLLVYNIFIVI